MKLLKTFILLMLFYCRIIAQTCPDDDVPGINKCKEPEPTTLEDKSIRICQGCHFGGFLGGTVPCLILPPSEETCSIDEGFRCPPADSRVGVISDPVFRVLDFTTFLNETNIYNIIHTGNQADWNKLMRIVNDDQCQNDQYYLSLG